jgi:hypothetical protein
MYFVVYESISLFGNVNYKNVEAFETLEDARVFAREIMKKGSPSVHIARAVETEERLAN